MHEVGSDSVVSGSKVSVEGCGTALVTPFLSSGKVDEGALRALVSRQIGGGVDFLVPCGTTGETPTLNGRERLRVVELVLDEAAGRLPVVAGAGGNSTTEVVQSAMRLAASGVDGLLSVTPYYNKPNQEGLYRHYANLAQAVTVPIFLYDVPGRTGVSLAVETVARLAEIPNIAGLKEASGDLSRIVALQQALPAEFVLLSGEDGLVLPIMAAGGRGVISVVSNLVPAWMSALVRACQVGDFAWGRKLQARLAPLVRACFLETNPIPVKAALAMQGHLEEVYRLPLAPIHGAKRTRLRSLLEECGLLAQERVEDLLPVASPWPPRFDTPLSN